MKTKEMIDVSFWQGSIAWDKVKLSGIDYAIIKATQGQGGIDNRFYENIQNAQKAGIKCGVYHYLTATNEISAIEEANHFITTIRPYNNILWCAVDVEDDCLPYSRGALTKIVEAFAKRVTDLGYKAIMYTNPSFLTYRLNAINIPLWLGLWRSRDNIPSKYEYPNMIAWQYGIRNVDGINGDVDADLIFIEESEEMTEAEKKEFNSLKNECESLKKRIETIENKKERIYNTNDDIRKVYGDDGVNVAKYFCNKGVLRGTGSNAYGLNDAEMRSLIWLYRFINR